MQNDGVLVQEFLEGKEYVCDTVSRDGASKCVAIWEYHKEAVNGHSAPIVYFGQKTLVVEEEEVRGRIQHTSPSRLASIVANAPFARRRTRRSSNPS